LNITQIISSCCFLLAFLLISCSKPNNGEPARSSSSNEFKNYWFVGKAEISSYHLSQSRYGEERKGNAMLIFVTEDFSKNKQVKLDDPNQAGNDKVSVLKVNMTKNFVTGIYPYSMMLSAFTPVDVNKTPNTLKVTMSSQEWCGQVFSQVNLRNQKYEIINHSYFEKEGDHGQNLKVSLLEDELWNRIRLDPHSLPVGETEIIPGFFFLRLNHIAPKSVKAICTKSETSAFITYLVTYPSHRRSIALEFEKAFPYRINGWIEKIEKEGTTFMTTATLDKRLFSDYWTKNKNEFLYLRDSLGLSHQNF
jgi:hypothetical protein